MLGPYHDVNLHHDPSEAQQGRTWTGNYFDDSDGDDHYTPGEDLQEFYDRDWKYVNYQEDFWYNPDTGQTESEEWDPGMAGSYDHSAWMAAGANLWASYRGLADPQGTYDIWAYQTGLNGFLWDDYHPQNAPHVVLDHAGINRFVMQQDGGGGFDWYCPIEYIEASLREGMPVSLGYGDGYLTVHGIDPTAGTLWATDTHRDPGGDALASYQYDPATLQFSGPAAGTIDYLCSEDTIAWYRGMNGYWSTSAAWSNQHTPNAAQTVYLSHPNHINLHVDSTAAAKAIYFNTPNPGQKMNVEGSADLTVSEDVALGDGGNGEIHHYSGRMTVGGELRLGGSIAGKGEYEIRDGTLTTGATQVGVGGIGRFIHDGGTHEVASLLSLGHAAEGDGYYELRQAPGATSRLVAFRETIGHEGVGLFKQTGGVNTVSGSLTIGRGGWGTYVLEGGHLDLGVFLHVGSDAPGLLHQTGGSIAASHEVQIGGSDSGTYLLEGGSFAAWNLGLGTSTAGKTARLTQSLGTTVGAATITVGNGSSGIAVYTMSGGPISGPTTEMATEVLIVGEQGTAEFNQIGESAFVTLTDESWIGHGGDASATYQLDRGTLKLGGVLHVGRTGGLDPGTQPPSAHLDVSDGFIIPLDPAASAAMVVVHGSAARLTGEGFYRVPVMFESDPIFGPGANQAVSVSFAEDLLIRSKPLHVSQSITDANVGSSEKAGRLRTATLDDSWFRVDWSQPGDPDDLQYQHTTETAPVPLPEVAVPYDPAQVAGNSRVAAAAIEPRMHLWQFRDGMVRNIAEMDDDGVVAVDATGKMIHGGARRVEGDFAVAVGGKAVDPLHQNPAVAALHARGLIGEGVVIGQLELGVPYAHHGCFADFGNPDPAATRVSVETGADARNHASQVASIMVGYDPLGLQVDGQSWFVEPDRRYGSGCGFVGVAPGAELHSRALPNSDELADELEYLSSVPGMKVINASLSFNFQDPNDGMLEPSRCLDHWIAERWAEPFSLGPGRTTTAVAGRGLIHTQAAGNGGTTAGSLLIPADSYNSIVVGNARFDDLMHIEPAYATVADTSGRGPTADGRAGIDLIAQGTGNLSAFAMTHRDQFGARVDDPDYEISGSRGLYSTSVRVSSASDPNATAPAEGTSYAAPTVAGMTALMVEQARKMGEPLGESPLVVKSILMTSADKLDGWEKGAAGAADDHTVPLDYAQGAGLLDAIGAMDLLADGRQSHGPDPVDHSGWAWSVLFADDFSEAWGFDGHLYLLEDVPPESTMSATLNWYRHVFDASGAGTYETQGLTDLNLELLRLDGESMFRVDWSESPVDNVEHLHGESLSDGGDYLLHVTGGFLNGRFAEEYALSWQVAPATAVPEPHAILLLPALLVLLARRTAGPSRHARAGSLSPR